MEYVQVAAGFGPREQGQQDLPRSGDLALLTAALQVLMEGHEGGEVEAALGDAPDEGMRLGGFPAVGDGGGLLMGQFLGQLAEPVNCYLPGIFVTKGVDFSPELRQ